ncbi:MAG: DUF2130 domain-containing protein [Thermodesulfobacteriota bacterium]|nr:DUF2130 domain-containing protein [Thermodesulfobacteriota bacterium]
MAEIKCPHCGESFPLEKYLTSEHIKEIADVDIQKKVAEQVKLAQNEISQNYEKQKKQSDKIVAKKIEELEDEMEKKSEAIEKEKKNYQKLLNKANDEVLEKKEEELERKAKEIKEASRKKLEEAEALKEKAVEEERQKSQLQIDRLNQKIKELGVKPGGDSELSGETFEEIVKATAQKEFPGFSVEDIVKGKKGADLVITTLKGAKILIEAKNVKSFQSGFVSKMKEDIARESASHGIIVTNGVMPKEAKGKKYQDAGPMVSIVEFSNFIPALRIRVSMIDQITEAEWKMEGSKTKKDQLYAFVSSERFRNTVSTIMDSLQAAQDQLTKEENNSQKVFEERRLLLRKVYDNFYSGFKVEMQSYLLESESEKPLESLDIMGVIEGGKKD